MCAFRESPLSNPTDRTRSVIHPLLCDMTRKSLRCTYCSRQQHGFIFFGGFGASKTVTQIKERREWQDAPPLQTANEAPHPAPEIPFSTFQSIKPWGAGPTCPEVQVGRPVGRSVSLDLNAAGDLPLRTQLRETRVAGRVVAEEGVLGLHVLWGPWVVWGS